VPDEEHDGTNFSPYTDPEHHNGQTDRWTDDCMMPITLHVA